MAVVTLEAGLEPKYEGWDYSSHCLTMRDGVRIAIGVSYGGTAAELLLVNRHPAVKALAPLFSE